MKTIKDFKKFINQINLDENTEIFIQDERKFSISQISIIKFFKIANRAKYEELFCNITYENGYLWIPSDNNSEEEIREFVDPLDILDVKIKIQLNHDQECISIENQSYIDEYDLEDEEPKKSNLSEKEYKTHVLSYLKNMGVGESKRGFAPWDLIKILGGTELEMRTALSNLLKLNLVYRTGTTRFTKFVAIEYKDLAQCAFDELAKK